MSHQIETGDWVKVAPGQQLGHFGFEYGEEYEVHEAFMSGTTPHVRVKNKSGGIHSFMASRFEFVSAPWPPKVAATPAGMAAQVSMLHAAGVRGVLESDPTGKSLNEKGAKADAGKLRPTLIFRDMADALALVVKIATDGAVKYTPGGWLEVPNANERYDDADLRHMLKRYAGQASDADSGSLHLAHEAWNALAKLQLFLNDNPEHKAKL